MIAPAEIQLKAGRSYQSFLQSWLRGEAYLPLRFPIGKLPDDFPRLRAAVQQLQATAKAQRGYGYHIETRQQQMRSLGMQTLPVAVVFETSEDFLRFIEKEHEFQRFQQDVMNIREQLPQLVDWMERYPKKVIAQHEFWPGLLSVCRYFLDHPRSKLYIRELPIDVHTKFVEEHMGILRELLEEVLPSESILPNALTFQQRFGLREGEPSVSVRLSETFAILGGGFGVSILAAIPWLCESPIIYWGDLDAQGFQILSQLRSVFPHVISLMMDEQTFQTFSPFHVEGTPCSIRQLPHLTEEEHRLFLHLSERTLRLEQERISHAYALEGIKRCFLHTPLGKGETAGECL